MLEDPTVYELELTSWQKTCLRKRSSVAARAELIARFYIEMEYARRAFEFVGPAPGADLTIRTETSERSFEVKGTAGQDIDLKKLKVSSRDSFGLICSGVTVLRIMRVMTTKPLVAEMKYGRHFLLKEEPRWRATKG